MKITILGCGWSSGVPAIGCECAVCQSTNPKNKRTRVSVMVENAGRKLLIDTSPDLREQFLANHFKAADAILYTHTHADHLHGIDDVRSINFHNNAPVDAHMDQETYDTIKQRFGYVFNAPVPEHGWYKPYMIPKIFTYEKPFMAAGMEILALEQLHGKNRSTGFRIGDFAYSVDVNEMPAKTLETLKGIKLWVVDCLRYTPAPSHAHLALTLEWIARVKPELAVLTHMSHEFEYEALKKELPAGVIPAYDGMALNA